MVPPSNDGFLDLADAIHGLRAELEKAIDERDWGGSRLRFRLKPIQLTLQAVAKREGGAEGKVRWYVIEAGANASLASEVTQTLQLELEPLEIDTAGMRTALEVASERAAGPALPD